jgi:glucose/arabinose dehydrogenase
LIEVLQPATNHNGGHILFGPDNYLYTAFGDGGPQRDPNGYSQSFSSFLGAMLRIDVDGRSDDKPYAIPADNPFVKAHQDDASVFPEIWATGFREPWRFSFDEETDDLWLGDVGQEAYEEVSVVRKGENHGWNVYEAFHEFSKHYRRANESFVLPIFAYSHQLGTSITGGHVYRGDKNSPLYGYYIFGDHEYRRLFALAQKNHKLTQVYELGFSPQRISAFATDAQGELHLLGYQGTVFHCDLSSVNLTPR